MRIVVVAVLSLAACTGDDSFVEHNVERVCAQACAPSEPHCGRIEIAVDITPATPGCLTDVEASCSLTTTSYSVLTVSTELRGTPTEVCTRELKRYTAYCAATVVLSDWTYRVEYGDQTMFVTSPWDGAAPPCITAY